LTTISSKVATVRAFRVVSNAIFFKSLQRIELIGLHGAWFAILSTLNYRASALHLAARQPTPIGRSCFSSAHAHLTSREAESELLIYEDL
jgi:hypothetical protein